MRARVRLAWGDGYWVPAAGRGADGLLAPTRYADDDPRSSRRFVREYLRAYGARPDRLAAGGYDAMNVLAAAIERAGVAAPRPVREALTRAEYVGTQDRTHRFDPSNQLLLDTYVVEARRGTRSLVARLTWDGELVQDHPP